MEYEGTSSKMKPQGKLPLSTACGCHAMSVEYHRNHHYQLRMSVHIVVAMVKNYVRVHAILNFVNLTTCTYRSA